MAARKNKFDPAPEPEKFEPETCDAELNSYAEEFLVFVRRCFGTSARAPMMVGGEQMNGALVGNLAEAFAICYGLGKQAGKPTAPAEPDSLAARRAALENGVRSDA